MILTHTNQKQRAFVLILISFACLVSGLYAQGVQEQVDKIVDIYEQRIDLLSKQLIFATNICYFFASLSFVTAIYFLFDYKINPKIDFVIEKILAFKDWVSKK